MTVHLKVDPYDAHHKALLEAYPNAAAISSVLSKGARPDIACFLTYLVFREKGPYDGFRNFAELSHKVRDRIPQLRDHLDYECGTVRSRRRPKDFLPTLTEQVGEAGALCAVSAVHGLTEADWERIPISKTKTFDYKLASDGHRFIEVECKGSVVEDNSKKSSSVSNHNASIEAKKKALGKSPSAVRYGVITVIDDRKESTAQCWLLDPDAESVESDPAKFKLLCRMRFLARLMHIITPGSVIVTALQNRIAAIASMVDYGQLDGVRLVNGSGLPFRTSQMNFRRHSTAHGGLVVGRATPLTSEEIFFLGIERRMYRLVVQQDFESIASFKGEIPSSGETIADLRLNRTEARRFEVLPQLERRLVEMPDRGDFKISLAGTYQGVDSGRVFGVIGLNP